MSSRIRIPFLIDVIRIKRPDHIRTLAEAPELDRKFIDSGLLFNRIIYRRLRRTMRVGNKPLPSATQRDDEARKIAQSALTERLAIGRPSANAIMSSPAFEAMVSYFQHRSGRSLELRVQEFIGRLFVEQYTATTSTWNAAKTIDMALRSNNPVRRLVWAVTGKVQRAQLELVSAVGGDLAGVHATGIAVHSMLRAVAKLIELYDIPHLRETLTPEAAAGRALLAPERVIRQAVSGNIPHVGTLAEGTLVIFETREGGRRSLDPAVIFLSESWSYCPAHSLVPAVLKKLWQDAIETDLATVNSQPRVVNQSGTEGGSSNG